MPTFPTYTSQRNITARTPEPERNEASAYYQNEQKILGTMSNIAQSWSDAHDAMQYTEAKARYSVAQTDILSRAEADPDFKSRDKYNKELASAKEASLKSIDNGAVRNKLLAEFEYGNEIAALKIDADFKNKEVENNKVMVKLNLDELMRNRLSAVTPAEAQSYDNQISELLSVNVNTGVLSPEDAAKTLDKSRERAVEALVYSDPERAIARLEESDLGLDPKAHYQFKKQARDIIDRREEYAKWMQKQTTTDSIITLSTALQEGTLTPGMVRDLEQDGMIDSEVAAVFDSVALNKQYDIPASTSLAAPDYFIRLLEDSAGDKGQIEKVLVSAAEAYGDNKLGNVQLLYLVQNAKETFDRQRRGINTRSEGQNKVIGALRGIVDAAKTFGGNAGAMVGRFLEKFAPGERTRLNPSSRRLLRSP